MRRILVCGFSTMVIPVDGGSNPSDPTIVIIMECIFCKFVRENTPIAKIYEDDSVLAFLDINPVNKGHILVIPRGHYETVPDMPDEVLRDLIVVVKKVANAVVKATKADGFNIIQKNRRAAGQVIDHVHFHIIPRFQGDARVLNWPMQKYEQGEINKYAEAIKQNM